MKKQILYLILFFLLAPVFSQAADISFERVDDCVTVSIENNSVAIDVIESDIEFYDAEIQRIEVADSAVDAWISEPSFSNENGTISFGAMFENSFLEEGGELFKIYLSQYTVPVFSIVSGAFLYSEDGEYYYEDISGRERYPINTQKIFFIEDKLIINSNTHPDSNEWYSIDDINLSWDLPDTDIQSVKLLLDKNKDSYPTVEYTEPIEEKIIEDVSDGIWYFHVRYKDENGWSSVSTKRIMIDTTPPVFDVEVERSNFDISFNVVGDDVYYCEYYLKEDQKRYTDVSTISLERPGKHTIEIRCFDEAGNYDDIERVVELGALNTPIVSKFLLDSSNRILLKGFSEYPNVFINVCIKNEEDVFEGTSMTDENGEWVYRGVEELEEGVYQVWLETEDMDGNKSFEELKNVLKIVPNQKRSIKDFIFDCANIITLIILILMFLCCIRIEIPKTKRKNNNKKKKKNDVRRVSNNFKKDSRLSKYK